MDQVRLEVRASMFTIEGDPDAELPDGPGGVVLAGPEAIFVAGRVAADAPTMLRIGTSADAGDLVLAYAGEVATPNGVLRVVNTEEDLLAQVDVPTPSTRVAIYLTNLVEPDEILVAL